MVRKNHNVEVFQALELMQVMLWLGSLFPGLFEQP